eukprot:Hpha_TRINITY_DN16972_c1_g1::TRINITY_DN16972_c1_g1_i5::g.55882::m.55882
MPPRGADGTARRVVSAAALLATADAWLYQQNQAVKVFSDPKTGVELTCDKTDPDIDIQWDFKNGCSCDTSLSGASLMVEEGYVANQDRIDCPNAGANGLTTKWDSSTGVLHVEGTASLAVYSTVISECTFFTSSGDGNSRRVTYAFGNAAYSTATGHWYEYFHKGDQRAGVPYPNCECPASQCTPAHTKCHWDDAQSECADPSHEMLGMVGYLVTITSQAEQTLITAKLHGEGWMGATDAAREGEWRWVTGPEGCPPYDTSVGRGSARSACDLGYPMPESKNPCSGPQCGQGMLMGTTSWGYYWKESGVPQWWASGEPNEWSQNCPGSCSWTGEDFGHFFPNGQWNDYPDAHTHIEGYACEWGGVGELCVSENKITGTQVLIAGCATYNTVSKCDAHLPAGHCAWDYATDKCVEYGCHALDNEPDCKKDLGCMWDRTHTPPECVDSYCKANYETDKAGCNADVTDTGAPGWGGPCHWIDTADDPNKCQTLHCYDITDKCECLQLEPTCIWDWTVAGSAGGVCTDPRFERCPAADLVFVVDGSGSMRSRFGTHPHGFNGLMEELRSWLHDSDLASQPDQNYGIAAHIVQFSKETYAWWCLNDGSGCTRYQSARCDKPTPDIPCTNGMLSHEGGGSPKRKLDSGIDWHEDNFISSSTYLEQGLLHAEQVLKDSSHAAHRKKYVFIITDGQLRDSVTTISEIEKRIEAQMDSPQIFGVVIRKDIGINPASLSAERTLKPLTSEPHDTHFVNIDLDHFKENIMDKLCDPTSPFGSSIAKKEEFACKDHRTEATCKADLFCDYDVSGAKCDPSHCVRLCTEADCKTDPTCLWNTTADLCGRAPPTCADKNEADCKADDKCLWDQDWVDARNTCIENPCLDLTDSAGCHALQKDWPQPPCQDPGGQGDYCTVASICTWEDSMTPKCHVTPCTHSEQGRCEADSGCEWRPPNPMPNDPPSQQVLYCKPKICQYTSENACNADPHHLCEWDAAANPPTCVPKKCAIHYDSEKNCNADPCCHYDVHVSPPECKMEPCCQFTTSPTCDASPDCMWDGTITPPTCVDLNCKKFDNACECNENPSCTWHVAGVHSHCTDPKYSTCPDLDVGFLIDGSGSMNRAFGNHPQGFTGLLESLRDWVKTLPLTGESFTVGAGSTVRGGGFRITFHQFALAEPLPSNNHPTNCATGQCTDGKLSGNLNEIMGDVDWHEANFQMGWTYLHADMEDVAANTFDALHSPPHRDHVVIIIADGGLTDPDGDACCNWDKWYCWSGCGTTCGCIDGNWKNTYPGMLADAKQHLIDDDVHVFGVVMRRGTGHTFEDYNAEDKLKPLVSDPKDDHFMNLELDEIAGNVLETFCDPTSKFGKQVAKPVSTEHYQCAVWGYSDECNADPLCEWKTPALSTCDSADGCTNLNCAEVPTALKVQYSCNDCRLQRSTIVCGTQYANSPMPGHCGETTCGTICGQTDCDNDPKCKYNATAGICQRKVCEHTTETTCVNDPDLICTYDGGSCDKKPCAATFVEAKCLANNDCVWDTGVSPPTCKEKDKCEPETTEAGCLAHSNCEWDCNPAPGKCRLTLCNYPTETACQADGSCEYVSARCQEKKCINYNDIGNCSAADCENCYWVGKGDTNCTVDKCKPHDTTACAADDMCTWHSSATPPVCGPAWCPHYMDNQADCSADPRCTWDTTHNPPACMDEPVCHKPNMITDPIADGAQITPGTIKNSDCFSSPDCMEGSDAYGDYCTPVNCVDLTEACKCNRATKCFWSDGKCKDEHNALCPDLDVVFVFDGSGSMKAPFGSYPNGYVAVLEMFRDWFHTLTLTGEDHKTKGASDVTGGSFRVAMVQFSDSDEYWVCRNGDGWAWGGTWGCTWLWLDTPRDNCDEKDPQKLGTGKSGECTDGELSGLKNELDVDVNWHEENFQSAGTYLAKALEDAVHIFQGSPSWRRHILIVLTDGQIADSAAAAAQKVNLDAQDVMTFGVVVRKYDYHTPADLKAENSLKPILSSPAADHFINVPLEKAFDEVFADMCDPTSLFGKSIVAGAGQLATELPCTTWGVELECRSDAACMWDPTPLTTCTGEHAKGCPNLNCQTLSLTQKAAYACSECKLEGGNIVCVTGSSNTQTGNCKHSACEENCNQVECETPVHAPAGMTCEWKCTGTDCTCQNKLCDFTTQTACESDDLCIWNTTATPPTCEVDECLHFAPGPCNLDANCEWKNNQCVPKEPDCTKEVDMGTCNAHPSDKCVWQCRTGTCIYDVCGQLRTQVQCGTRSDVCQWETSSTPGHNDTCIEKHCDGVATEADCLTDHVCKWVNSKCEQKTCFHHASEAECNHDIQCHYDTAACGCNEHPCVDAYQQDSAACDADTQNVHCRWDSSASPPTCIEKLCQDYNNPALYPEGPRCPCAADSRCVLDTTVTSQGIPPICKEKDFAACPNLDVLITFDGSTSMNNRFGNHPNGFDALMEVLRTWLHHVPLTGEDASEGLNSDDRTGSMRIAFSQWDQGVRVAECPDCACSPKATKTTNGMPPTSVAADLILMNIGSPTAVNCGKLTGKVGQLDADLDWHENEWRRPYTRVKEAEEFSGDVFAESPAYRVKVLLIYTDGKISDVNQLGPAQARLDAEGVKTFGVVLRRGPTSTADDLDNLNTLKSIVTDPQDDHAMIQEIDDAHTVLDGFCDPKSVFGAYISAAAGGTSHAQSCNAYGTVQSCDGDIHCQWDDGAAQCGEHPCVAHCEEAPCTADSANKCQWNATTMTCLPAVCTDYITQSKCEKFPDCLWDPTKTPPCDDKPCYATTQSKCELLGKQCTWLDTPAPGECVETPCFYENQTSCSADPSCHWEHCSLIPTENATCVEKFCTSTDQTVCTGDARCVWGKSNKCEIATCAEYPTERCCDHDPQCHWDGHGSPPFCAQKYCPKTYPTSAASANCEADKECVWDDTKTPPQCVALDCTKLDRCECHKESECYWDGTNTRCIDPKFGMCPVMDIVVILDGSGSMRMGTFYAGHSHGFNALMEILRDWMVTLPLSGEKAGEDLGHPIGGVRLGFIQFSSRSEWGLWTGWQYFTHAVESPTGVGSGGRLSGHEPELQLDIDWHEDNFLNAGTRIKAGLDDAADMFDKLHKPIADRQRVLFIFTDGRIQDADVLAPARAELDKEGVMVFGIVVRKGLTHTTADLDAEATLKPIVSDPKADHFQNLVLDEVETKVLSDMCNPTGVFGKFIAARSNDYQAGVHQPCPYYTDSLKCNGDPGCIYNAATSKCEDSPCQYHCDEPTCTADTANHCVWNATTQECWKGEECAHKDQTSCEADSTGCTWDPTQVPECTVTPCNLPDEPSCEMTPGCEWKDRPAPGECHPIPCFYNNSAECLADTKDNCRWQTSNCPGYEQYCEVTPCTDTDQVACESDLGCVWDGTCKETPCSVHPIEKCCEHDKACSWSVAQSPAVCVEDPCHKIKNQVDCDANKDCAWNSTTGECFEIHCDEFTDRCPCESHEACYWHPPTGCVQSNFGDCPTMDIIILFDGNKEFSGNYGRHSFGYDGFIEAMRKWMESLPLNKEPALSLTHLDNGGARVGFIQYGTTCGRWNVGCCYDYCARRVWGVCWSWKQNCQPAVYRCCEAGPYNAEKRITSGTYGAKGSLTGAKPELEIELDWQENHFLSANSKINNGLTYAGQVFKAHSDVGDTRKKLLFIFSVKPIEDNGDTSAARNTLATQGVEVFGIAIKKQSTSDVSAISNSLLPYVGNDNSRVKQLELDDIYDKMEKICDTTDDWGHVVVPKAPERSTGEHAPCDSYSDKIGCEVDPGCEWSDAGPSCINSHCLVHCEEVVCNADTANNCTWNSTSGSCFKEPEPICDCKYDTGDVNYDKQKCEEFPNKCTWVASSKSCIYDECKEHGTTCTGAAPTSGTVIPSPAQTCIDPNTDPCSVNDWECHCTPPSNGTKVMGVVACYLDECEATCTGCEGDKCSDAGQTCIDDVRSAEKTGDWRCECPPPAEGVGYAAVAACTLDECIKSCPTCEEDACSNVPAPDGPQTCNDPNKDWKATGDWTCTCPPPATLMQIKGAVPKCEYDECTEGGKAATCQNAGQECVDPDKYKGGDWKCVCKDPTSGEKEGAIAVCTIDECAKTCPTCENGTMCNSTTDAQTCHDPNTLASSTGDWSCTCIAPNVGGPTIGGPATCTLDECEVLLCPTCENDVCFNAGQDCYDPVKTSGSTGDWLCICKPPSPKNQTGAIVASCDFDECDSKKDVCEVHGQTCNDTNLKTKDSWECTCPPPSKGSQSMNYVSPCVLDECIETCPTCAGTACSASNQICNDTNTARDKLGDWTCTCPPPSEGQATAGTASCVLDECTKTCPTCANTTCTAVNQVCNDANEASTSLSDWTCTCAPPSVTVATAAAATCEYDECVGPGAPGAICAQNGQLCVEPDNTTTGDWKCQCQCPGCTGEAPQAVADCVVDECAKTCPTCENGTCATGNYGQTCTDPDASSKSTGDWVCTCEPPTVGNSTGAAATCHLDECKQPCATCAFTNCTGENQVCYDPSQSPSDTGDWTCTCMPPSTSSKQAGPAVCEWDECNDHASTCIAAGQDCVDPDNTTGGWECQCRPPANGTAQNGTAICEIDECVKACPTCENDTCSNNGQTCDDPNKGEKSTGDWTCTCTPPERGTAVAGVAACVLDECVETCPTCQNTAACNVATEKCVDYNKNTTSKSDWYCECIAPATQVQKAGPVPGPGCEYDECTVHESTCETEGQKCEDTSKSPTSLNNWQCVCQPPATNAPAPDGTPDAGTTGSMAAALCAYPGECHFAVDPQYCSAAQKADCTAIQNQLPEDICKAKGQVCNDTTSLDATVDSTNNGDWMCQCPPPSTNPGAGGDTNTMGTVAACEIDECTVVGCHTCADSGSGNLCTLKGQSCLDISRDINNTSSYHSWECVCIPPEHARPGGADRNTAGVADCIIDECIATCTGCENDACSAAGQTCNDTDVERTSLGNWECSCPPPRTGKATAKVAECHYDECTDATNNAKCTGQGQTCLDTNQVWDANQAARPDDWECVCADPSKTTQVANFASPCEYDECTTH